MHNGISQEDIDIEQSLIDESNLPPREAKKETCEWQQARRGRIQQNSGKPQQVKLAKWEKPRWFGQQESQYCHPNPWQHQSKPTASGCNPWRSLSPEICSQICKISLQMTEAILRTQTPTICGSGTPSLSHAMKSSLVITWSSFSAQRLPTIWTINDVADFNILLYSPIEINILYYFWHTKASCFSKKKKKRKKKRTIYSNFSHIILY